MRILIYLLIIAAGAYVAFVTFKPKVKGVVPREVIKFISPTKEMPREYQGKFISDLGANLNFLRHSGYDSHTITKLAAGVGKQVIEVGPTSFVSRLGRAQETINLDVHEIGAGYVVVSYHHPRLDQEIECRVVLDGDGIVSYSDQPVAGYRERYRRIKE